MPMHHSCIFLKFLVVCDSYQRAWKEYLKFRYLLANRPKPSEADKRKLHDLEIKAQKLRSHSKLKREVTIALSAEGFRRTGIFCDVIQVKAYTSNY